MGCNMCVVKRPEEQYKIMFQVRSQHVLRTDGHKTRVVLTGLSHRDSLVYSWQQRGHGWSHVLCDREELDASVRV